METVEQGALVGGVDPDDRVGIWAPNCPEWTILRYATARIGATRSGVAGLTAEAVREFCAGRLAHYKILRHEKVVDAFPMTVTGKVRKVEMRETSVRELGLS